MCGGLPLPLPDFGRRGNMSNANEDDAQLKLSVSRNETWAEWGGAAVVLGLVIEVVLTASYRHGQTIISGWGPVFADALITLGVAAEILFARKARLRAETLQHRSEGKIAEANDRAATAELRTEQLRAQFSWRRLSPSTVKTISETLADFPKMSITITFVGNDPESNTFAHEIGSVFNNSGWNVGFTSASFSGEVTFGMIIAQPSSLDDSDASGVARIAASKAEIEYSGGFCPQWFMGAGSGDDVASPCAQMYVGPKPMPNLG